MSMQNLLNNEIDSQGIEYMFGVFLQQAFIEHYVYVRYCCICQTQKYQGHKNEIRSVFKKLKII